MLSFHIAYFSQMFDFWICAYFCVSSSLSKNTTVGVSSDCGSENHDLLLRRVCQTDVGCEDFLFISFCPALFWVLAYLSTSTSLLGTGQGWRSTCLTVPNVIAWGFSPVPHSCFILLNFEYPWNCLLAPHPHPSAHGLQFTSACSLGCGFFIFLSDL